VQRNRNNIGSIIARRTVSAASTSVVVPSISRPVPSTPRLGVTVDAGTLIITQVQSGSVAADVGLRPGDQLIAINGRPLKDISELEAFLNSRPDYAVFTVGRNRRLGSVRVDF
jgi:S1-C subfamily serine protease